VTNSLFVYGTLAPGGPAWSQIAPYVSGHRAAAAPGRLYDTGRGYPGAVFGPGDALVQGWCCALTDAPFAELDAFEGTEYRRITVRCTDGTDAVAYDWIAPLDGCTFIATGSWRARR
jgi:gamma-glutamylcyclotransferase (GGCT)/AIG2-like uncharacterized protein YtfP